MFNKKAELNLETRVKNIHFRRKVSMNSTDIKFRAGQSEINIKSIGLLQRSPRKISSFVPRLARWIFSIPATSTNVERQFSGAGLIIQERRTNLNPEQLNNILLIRSMEKYEHFFE